MKKFSINLLKVGLLLVIGLCMFGMTSEVEAATGELKYIDPEGPINGAQLKCYYFVNRGYRQSVDFAIQESCYNNSEDKANTVLKGDGKFIDAEMCNQTDGAAGPFYFFKKDGTGTSADHCIACYVVNLDLGLKDYKHKTTYSNPDAKNYGYQGAYVYEFDGTSELAEALTLKLDYKGDNEGALYGSDIRNKLLDDKKIGEILGVDELYIDNEDTTVTYTMKWVKTKNGEDLGEEYARINDEDKLVIDTAKVDEYFKNNKGESRLRILVHLDIGVRTNANLIQEKKWVIVQNNKTSTVKTGFLVYINNPYYGQKTGTVEENPAKYTLTLDYNKGNNETGEAWDGASDNKYTIVGNEVTVVENNNAVKKTITRDGYDFVGWASTQAQADAGTADITEQYYNKKPKVYFTITADTTIYAVWKKEGGSETTQVQLPSDELAVGDKLKYTYSSEGWNVRNTKQTKIDTNIVGEIIKDNIVKVKTISGYWVTVEYDGGEGYIYFNETAKGRFEKVDSATAITGIEVITIATDNGDNGVNNGSGNIGDLISGFNFDTEGIMGLVMQIISTMLNFLVNTILPNVEPMLETASNTLLPLVEKVIGGILQ